MIRVSLPRRAKTADHERPAMRPTARKRGSSSVLAGASISASSSETRLRLDEVDAVLDLVGGALRRIELELHRRILV